LLCFIKVSNINILLVFFTMSKTIKSKFFTPLIRFNKIRTISSLMQLKEEEGFTLVELIVVVMMIGILSSIAIPQFMTAADKAKQKEATGIVSALVKGATAYQTEYGVLPETFDELSEYAKFQACIATNVAQDGGKACRDSDPNATVIGPVTGGEGDPTNFYATSGNYNVSFQIGGSEAQPLFQVLANPNGSPYSANGSAVTGCYNPVLATSQVYEYTAKTGDKGQKTYRTC